MKLLLDEQISDQVAQRLRDRGHDVLAVAAVSTLRGRRDYEIFEFAQREGRAVVTFDRDFERIAGWYDRAGRRHHGLVIVLMKNIPSWEFARLTSALEALLDGPELWDNFRRWLQPAP